MGLRSSFSQDLIIRRQTYALHFQSHELRIQCLLLMTHLPATSCWVDGASELVLEALTVKKQV